MKAPNVVMVGLGYIGLPTAALIASKEIPVQGVDINESVVSTINRGEIHIIEPDLDRLVMEVVKKGTLKASTTPEKANVYLIAVPTPFKENNVPDLSYVTSAIDLILPTLEKEALVIIESTSPVGTTEKMYHKIITKRPELKNEFYMAYCPERVLPGNVIYELEHNDRAIGGLNEASTKKAKEFYKRFVSGDLHETNARTAEMCKLVENSSRDVQIAFANELSMICDKAAINVWELIALANKHPRVTILQPGTGVGGHCIAVDPWFIVSDFPEESKIIKSAREINNYKTTWVIEKIVDQIEAFRKDHDRRPTIACLGLAFKPNIDDLRESPALMVTHSLLQKGYDILPVEPNIKEHKTLKIYSMDEAISQADIFVFLVAHKEFSTIEKQEITLDFCGNYK